MNGGFDVYIIYFEALEEGAVEEGGSTGCQGLMSLSLLVT